MIDTTELHNLILVYMTLTLIQGLKDARKQKRLRQLSPKAAIVLNGTWYAVETC